MILLGLTGPIASGKSTVARLLAERGAMVIDCDQLAHKATAPRTPGLAAVIERFGEDLLRPDGSLDRGALGWLVFADPAALADLEAIVHPRVTALKDKRLAECRASVAVIEAIKLIEAGYLETCDALWVVTAPADLRIARLTASRGMSRSDAAQRVRAQGDAAEHRARADLVLVNDGDLAALGRLVDDGWRGLIDRA